MLDRRTFLAGATASAMGASLLPATLPGRPRSRVFDLEARPVRLPLGSIPECRLFAYNGTVPGPVLEVWEGDEVTVNFRNGLDEPTTVHWHGMHLPFDADGSPFHPVNPGLRYTYRFRVPMGSAGTYWYHPHPHHRTGYQVAHGLHGALLVRAREDPLAALPERTLVLWDNRLHDDGRVDLPAARSPQARIDFENGREGPMVFVNGRLHPTLRIQSGEVQRWRVVNASAARMYRLALEGHTLLQVGSDGGLFEHPIEMDELMLAPAERVEVLVRGTAPPGTRATLHSLPHDRYIPQTRPADWQRPLPLLTLEYQGTASTTMPRIPTTLRPVIPLDPTMATAVRVMSLSQGMINGRHMDPARVDVHASLGATEIWEIENLVGMDHPFHLHGFQFQVLDRDGVPEPFRCWKDVVNVPRHERARFIVRYNDFPGKWMFHCHILDHEDQGMMGILEVR